MTLLPVLILISSFVTVEYFTGITLKLRYHVFHETIGEVFKDYHVAKVCQA